MRNFILPLASTLAISLPFAVQAQPTPPPPAPAAVAVPTAAPPPAPFIDWTVDGGFRLFDSTDQQVARKAGAILDWLSTHPLSGRETYDFLARELRADRTEGPALYASTRFDRAGERYNKDVGPGQSNPYLQPRAQRIVASLKNAGAADRDCTWTAPGAPPTLQPCADPFVFDLPFGAGSFNAQGVVTVTTNAQTPVQPALISTQDVLVLGLGDSYGAGEGNPDKPADLRSLSENNTAWPTFTRAADWWRTTAVGIGSGGVLYAKDSAQWWSNECHRSLFSPQVLAALKLAASNRHGSVTFVGLACSGAATLDGLVTAQASPPGEARSPGNAARESQLSQALDLLCLQQPQEHTLTGYASADLPVWKALYEARHATPPTYPSCPEDQWRRRPDLILISLGGNDIGFAGLGAWALLPTVNPLSGNEINLATQLAPNKGLYFVCPQVPLVGDPRCIRSIYSGNLGAEHLIRGELPDLLSLVKQGLTQSGLSSRAAVIHVAYPMPFNNELGQSCGAPTPEFPRNQAMTQPWRALDVFLVTDDLSAYATKNRVDQLASVLNDLNAHIAAAYPETASETVVPAPSEYARHGFCAGSGKLSADFGFPLQKLQFEVLPGFLQSYGGGWDPAGLPPTGLPSSWDPYQHRDRWLRVANDSLLTQMVGDDTGVVEFESLTGMLHPTAEGNAAIADGIFAKMLVVHAQAITLSTAK